MSEAPDPMEMVAALLLSHGRDLAAQLLKGEDDAAKVCAVNAASFALQAVAKKAGETLQPHHLDMAFVALFAVMIRRGACPHHFSRRAAELAVEATNLAHTLFGEGSPGDPGGIVGVEGDFETVGGKQ